jgi:pimeloyl-ACP methyl ester carboxylesterase
MEVGMDHVEVGGLRVTYRQAGQGPPLVLLHGGLGDSREWRRQLEGLADDFTVTAWDAPGCGGSSDPPETFRLPGYLPGLFTDSASAELVEEALAMMLDVRPAGMRPMLQGFAEADLRDVLSRIEVPTLLLYGDADRRSPVEVVGRDLNDKIPGSRLVVMPGVGHQSDMEAPDRFNAEVRGFLRSEAASGTP